MPVNADPQDGLDAADRARSGFAPGWHPILAAVEQHPGEWWMTTQYGDAYAVVRLIRRGGETGYRSDTWAPSTTDREFIGYFRTLRAATYWAHRHWLRTLATPGGVNGT
jgi:hypothetical protein